MSLSAELEAAFRAELSKPELRTAIENLEGTVLTTAFNAINAALPGFVRTLAGGLINTMEAKGLEYVKKLTDEELLKISGGSMTITEIPMPNSDSIHTVADLKAATTKK